MIQENLLAKGSLIESPTVFDDVSKVDRSDVMLECQKSSDGILRELKKSIYSSIVLVVSAVLTAVYPTSGLAESEPGYGYGQNCRLAVFPYNPNAKIDTEGSAANAYINMLSGEQCATHVTYQEQYLPQPPQASANPLKPGSESVRAPVAQHQHSLYNSSNGTNGDVYYKLGIDKFEIMIQSDGFSSLHVDNISCITSVPRDHNSDSVRDLFDCDGYDPNLYGGTKVTKVSDWRKKTITITWDFAENPAYNNGGRPFIYGGNGTSFVVYDKNGGSKILDLPNPESRRIGFYINLPTKNNAEQSWSATTTSRALIADLAIVKPNIRKAFKTQEQYQKTFGRGCTEQGGLANPNNGWCYIEPEAGYETKVIDTPSGSHTFYWYPIGSISTVWRKPSPSYDDNPLDVSPNNIDELYADINDALDKKDYNRASGILDKLLAGSFKLDGNIFTIAAQVYDKTQQYDKEEPVCDRGTKELDSTRNRAEYIKLLDVCAENLVDNINPEKGLQYLLLKHALQAGTTDKQTLLKRIAFNEHDVIFSVMALKNAGKYEEAADLLTFYFQQNPALVDKPIQQNDFFTIAKGLGLEHHAMSALSYFYDRKSDQAWRRRLDKLVQVGIPVGIVVGGIYTATQQQAQREAEERKKAEEEARRQQAARDAENARRRAQGLPTLEEEEQRKWQEQQAVRDRTRARCLERCETNYHSCIGNSDPKCCNEYCFVTACPSDCSSDLASCRRDCD